MKSVVIRPYGGPEELKFEENFGVGRVSLEYGPLGGRRRGETQEALVPGRASSLIHKSTHDQPDPTTQAGGH
jgi:hypothetical protein